MSGHEANFNGKEDVERVTNLFGGKNKGKQKGKERKDIKFVADSFISSITDKREI